MSEARKWSKQQDDIFYHLSEHNGHILVRARAGTGKTTTILEGINYAPEDTILLAAFNKKIATELQYKLTNPKAEAKTLHSLGFRTLLRNWNNTALDDERGAKLAAKGMGLHNNLGDEDRKAIEPVIKMVKRLASLGKNAAPFPKPGELVDLAYKFEIEPSEEQDEAGWTVERLARAAEQAMHLAATQRDGTCDFDDMVFVPVRNKWVRGWYELVIIDEAQDMNESQLLLAQALCKRGGRIMVVGDDMQAIYGFRGADSNSLDRLKKQLNAKELGLTITYRCPTAVVESVKHLVPDFTAAPGAPSGKITDATVDQMIQGAQLGDFILSRKNAPLAQMCLKLLKNRKRARIEGKETGRQLINLVKKFSATTFERMYEKLKTWEDRECAKLLATGKESAIQRIELVHDQADCIRALSEDLIKPSDLVKRIEELFEDTPGGVTDFIRCSSVHRAKGLETDRVWLLSETLYPGGRTSDQEEKNIEYVANTRAKKELVKVTGLTLDKPKKKAAPQ